MLDLRVHDITGFEVLEIRAEGTPTTNRIIQIDADFLGSGLTADGRLIGTTAAEADLIYLYLGMRPGWTCLA